MQICTDDEGLELFRWHVSEFGRSPSVKRMQTLAGYRSRDGARKLLRRLAERGFLSRVGPTPCRNKPYYSLVQVGLCGPAEASLNEGLL